MLFIAVDWLCKQIWLIKSKNKTSVKTSFFGIISFRKECDQYGFRENFGDL